MKKPGKYENFQMGLFDEWECSQMVKGLLVGEHNKIHIE